VTRLRPLLEEFLGVMPGMSLGTLLSNFKSVALTVFELLAFNAQKFRRSRPWPQPLLDKFLAVMSGLSLGTLVPNLKSIALIVFEILAFNAEKYRVSRDSGHANFWKNFWGS